MLNQDTLLVKIGRNRSGESAGRIDMEVAVQRVADLCYADFVELMETLCAAGDSCMQAWDGRELDPPADALRGGSILAAFRAKMKH